MDRKLDIKEQDHGYDLMLFAAIIGLVVIGAGVLSSAVFGSAQTSYGYHKALRYVIKHGIALTLGTLLMLLIASVPKRFHHIDGHRFINWLTLGMLVLLLGLFVAGHHAKGAVRWYRIGPVSIQVGEFFKVVFMIYLAYTFGSFQHLVQDYPGNLWHVYVLFFLIEVAFIFLPDRGTAIQLMVLFGLIAFVAGMKLRYLVSAGVVIGIASVLLAFTSHRIMSRILNWIGLGSSHGASQIHASTSMVISGGLWGMGLGKGLLGGLRYLPESHTDYIASVLIEDLGIVGLAAIVLLYLVILWRVIMLERSLKSPIDRLIVTGLVLLIISQAIIHIMVNLNIFPAKGTSLPFISYGGSSMLAFFGAVGVIQYIYRFGERKEEF